MMQFAVGFITGFIIAIFSAAFALDYYMDKQEVGFRKKHRGTHRCFRKS